MRRLVCLLATVVALGVYPRVPHALHAQSPPESSVAPDDDEENEDAQENAEQGWEFFLLKRLPPGATELPLDRYLAAREAIEQMPVYSIANRSYVTSAKPGLREALGNSWTSVGPGNIGGRTRALVIHPQNPDIIYAGAATGGVWKSTDGGGSWTPLTDLLPLLAVGALVMDPFDPSTLYAATGEVYGGFPGQGVFKTTDAGATWNLLAATGTVRAGSSFVNTTRLTMSPRNRGRIYASTYTGIWTSPDGGATWQQIAPANTVGRCDDLAIRSDAPADYLFASCSGISTIPYSIFRNTDAAGTGRWTAVYSTPNMGRTTLALAPSQPSTIYALAASIGGDPHY